ncbi:MAG: acyl carrier protein [Methylocystaceae bacterium]
MIEFQDFYILARGYLADQLDINADSITLETSFEDIDADSIDIVEMIMALEDKYDVEFPEDELDDFKTMGQLVRALYDYLVQAKS